MITLEIDTGDISRAIANALSFMGSDGMSDLLGEVADQFSEQYKDRIDQGGPAPDGSQWAPKLPSTIERYKRKGEGADSRPLFHLGLMSNFGIFPFSGPDFAGVRVSAPYGAMMQFGAKKGAFGPYSVISKLNGRKYSGVAPWGDIPARPFIGLSAQDEQEILDSISEALARALE